MDNNRNDITSRQLGIFLISAQIGIGILTLPSELAHVVGHEGWISILGAGAIVQITLVFIVMLLRRYVDKSIYEINILLFGMFLGKLLNLLISMYLVFATTVGLRIFIEVIKVSVLRFTPPVILTVVILIPTFYLVWYGLKPVCRFASTMIVNYGIVVFFIMLVIRDIRLTSLQPIGEADISSILSGIKLSMFAFLGIELIPVVYSHVTDKKNIFKNIMIANILTTLFFTSVVVITTGFFSKEVLETAMFPLFSLFRSYEAPVVERVDLFFIAIWFPVMATSMRAYFFAAFFSIEKLFIIKKRPRLYWIFTVSVIALSRIPNDLVNSLETAEFLNTTGIIVIGFQVLCFGLSFINKRGVSAK